MTREYTLLDRALMGADRSLKTLVKGSSTAQRHNPASSVSNAPSADQQRRHNYEINYITIKGH